MKKAFGVFCIAALLMPLIVGAVTWQVSSNQFHWPAVGAKSSAIKVLQSSLFCRTDAVRGVVTIHYSLPSVSEGATLKIYNVNGDMVQSFNLSQGNNAIQWSVTGNRVAAGIYVASMRHGNSEQNIQISIIK